MERIKKIELLKSLKEGTRPAKEVIEMLTEKRIEIDNFHDALMITSCPGNYEGKEIIATGQLKKALEQIENESIN